MKTITRHRFLLSLLAIHLGASPALSAAPATAELKSATVSGGISDGKARLVIEADIKGLSGDRDQLIFATALQHTLRAAREKLTHTIRAKFDILQGEPKEIPLLLAGEGEVRSVTGDGLQDWNLRQEPGGARWLVLRPKKSEKAITQLAVTITAETLIKSLPLTVTPLNLAPAQPALFNGYVKVELEPDVDLETADTSGLVPIELKFLPEELRGGAAKAAAEPLAFRFLGSAYALPVRVTLADPEARRVVLDQFSLRGTLSDDTAVFRLSARARVRNPKGGSIELLSGGLALTEAASSADWRLRFDQGRFVLTFDKPGEFPVQFEFNAAVRSSNGWSAIDFRVAPAALQPVTFQGLAPDTQFRFAGAARPERAGGDFTSFLPAGGAVQLAWKQAKTEAEGKLFYAAEALSQVTISPGLMRQLVLLDFKVMQGELGRVTLLLRGAGEVTRVAGDPVLAWNVQPVPNSTDRRIEVQLNQPQKDAFAVQVQIQTPLGAFPLAVDVAQVRPEGATRFAGYFRVSNEGAVRLEVVQSTGLSQVSPDQFPVTESSKALFQATGSQRFAFRFSGAEFALRVQADNVLPELSVSQVLAYHLGETELVIDGEIELDIREAPLREVLLRVPKGYALARLTAPGLSDYFLRDPADTADAELRLVYGQPISGRQVIQLRLERNQPLAEAAWALPRLEVSKAKSTRGHVGVSADPGFRLTAERTQALTEIATAFFPRKVANIQAAFRLSEPGWAATLRVERLPQTVQASAMHLFSIGEGIAYGSSVLNYLVSGAPVSAFRIELSGEYFNVEFSGKDIRNWQKTTNGYTVQLHTPVSGAYTLLVTYERPFKAQGETLAFTGARPLDAQTEQGYTLVVSAYQFQVQPAEVSPGLLPLEPGEVPAEDRLFFDAPLLAAYRYTSRPFTLRLALSPLAQGDSLSQVVDRASLTTRISKEGQVITDARYFVKNRGVPHFRLTLPDETELWTATVNGLEAVPVKDGASNLIPLPQRADPNAVLTVDLKLASRAKNPKRLQVAAPIVAAPVLLGEWKLVPDTRQRLAYRRGSLTPVGGVPDVSGFAGVTRLFTGPDAGLAWGWLGAILGLAVVGLWGWRWASREGTYRWSVRHLAGIAAGLLAFGLVTVGLVVLGAAVVPETRLASRDITFLAPVQQSGSALSVTVDNLPDEPSAFSEMGRAWPALLALVVWVHGWLTARTWLKPVSRGLGWTLLAWAALRGPNGGPWFFVVFGLFLGLHLVLPALMRLARVPIRPSPPPSDGVAPAVATLLIGGLLGLAHSGLAQSTQGVPKKEPALAASVAQQIQVEDQFAFATAQVRWPAAKGQLLPVLFEPAVLTRIRYPTNALKLVQAPADARRGLALLALADGTFEVELQYQLHVAQKDGEHGLVLPTPYGLVNRLTLRLAELDVDVTSPQAVSVQRQAAATNQTVAQLVLSPVHDAWIGWKPRSRDVKREKAVFYAELLQLYVPSAGVIEGAHQVQVRPAQGELGELVFDVPGTATITDVLEPARLASPDGAKNPKTTGASGIVSLWRFDPDARRLRVSLNPPQSRPFTLIIRSQVTTTPLPFEQSIGLISVDGAAGQIGLLGVATGSEVQLDNLNAEAFSPINLEDYPGGVLQALQGQFAGLTVRRAFRYADVKATATLKASAVEPDVRVETQETLSLGEDRSVLAANLNVEITRAGIFRLSFLLPTGLDVEAISGQALSHWTELRTDAGRVITLHLRGRTEGRQPFAVSLAGPGLRAATNWVVPRLLLREAAKQQGQLVIAPEQGMRLQVTARDGVTQLDPQRADIRQKGVLAFRLLSGAWRLALDIEQVDPWIQVTSLQHVTVSEAQARVTANLQYQIENTGLKALAVSLPTNAESVRFTGEQVADFLPRPGAVRDGLQVWDVKLHRRVMGKYLLSVSYQWRTADNATQLMVDGVQAGGVNLQRGFVTVQSGGRLQVRVPGVPPALQPSEWQTVPRSLRQEMEAASANYTFRLVEPAYRLPIQLERHEAARLLAARVNNVTLTSVISDEGVMLTQARLVLVPGDKRLLRLTLPPGAEFWFAFVNQHGVWPWRDRDQWLLPLESQARGSQAIALEFFYSSRIGPAGGRALDLELLGPKFDLPLESITWQVYLNEKWQLKDWTGSLQLREDQTVAAPASIDVQTYLQNETSLQKAKTRQAEQMLALGNSALEQGDPQQARRAFQAAYGLSTHDDAFNEDARVQLHNLKLQQALVGLNFRSGAVAGDSAPAAAKLRDLRARKQAAYTQQEAKQIIDANTADDNAALMRLAERLVQQQDAAVATPTAIRASIPQQGRLLTFTRAVQVDTWADLRIGLEAKAVRAASSATKLLWLAGVFVAVGLLSWMARAFGTGGKRTQA